MSAAPDLAELDAMLDTTLAALGRRAAADFDAGEVSFGAGDQSEAAPAEVEVLWQMVALARGQGSGGTGEGDDGAVVSFAAGDEEVGRWARLRQDAVERVEGLLSVFVDDHVIETGQGPTRIRTQVGWRGDTRSLLVPGVTAEQVAAHLAATATALDDQVQRLHGLAMVLSAASRIAALIAAPGGAVMALPIAYECVRGLHRRWSGSRSNQEERRTRGTPW